MINDMTKLEVESHIQKNLAEIFSTKYSDDMLQEIMIKMLPTVFTAVLFDRMTSALSNLDGKYHCMTHTLIQQDKREHRTRVRRHRSRQE